MDNIIEFVQASWTPPIFVALALWKSDSCFSKEGKETIYSLISNSVNTPIDSKVKKVIQECFLNYFNIQGAYSKLFYNVFIYTLASTIILLSLYTYKTVGLFEQLGSWGFIKQFVAQGFVVTYLVNLLTIAYYPIIIAKIEISSLQKIVQLYLLDVIIKIILLISFTCLTYILFAKFSSAFGGSIYLALDSVYSSLLSAIQFKNLSSVYVYSILISSFPLFIIALISGMSSSSTLLKFVQTLFFWLPFKETPLRALAIILATVVLTFSLVLLTLITLTF